MNVAPVKSDMTFLQVAEVWALDGDRLRPANGGDAPSRQSPASQHCMYDYPYAQCFTDPPTKSKAVRSGSVPSSRGAEGGGQHYRRNNEASVRRRLSASTGLCSMAKPLDETSVSRSSAVSPVTSKVG